MWCGIKDTGLPVNSLQVTICNYRKKHGKDPEWYNRATKQVNIGQIRKQTELAAERRNYAQSFYYRLMNKFKTETAIAARMAEVLGGSAATWRAFLQQGLWRAVSDQIVYVHKHGRIDRFIEFAEGELLK